MTDNTSMMKIDDQEGVMRVVHADELDVYTRNGARLVAVLRNETLSEGSRLERADPGDSSCAYSRTEYLEHQTIYVPAGMHLVRTKHVVARCDFLIRGNADHVLARKEHQIQQLNVELKSMTETALKLEKEFDAAKKSAEQYKGLYDGMQQENRRVDEQHQKVIESKRKMEEDLAKIRSAIGELKMKEILAVAKT